MLSHLQTARRSFLPLWRGIGRWPVWGALLLAVSMLGKLWWLDGQFDVGGMNHWKWQVNIGAVLLAVCWTPLLRRRARAAVLLLLDGLLSLLMFADLIYFRYFKDFITVPVLLQAGQVGELDASIATLIHAGDLLLFADLPVAAVLTARAFRTGRSRREGPDFRTASSRFRRAVRPMLRGGLAVLAAAAGALLIAVPVEEQKNGWARGLFGGNWWNVPIYNVTGLFGFHGYDLYRYAKENWWGGGITAEEIAETRRWFEDRRASQSTVTADPLFGAFRGKNVFVVQAEAFQTFVLGLKVGGEEVTPNLNRLIKSSLFFSEFYHQTGQGRTSDADFAANCSLHPLPSGSVFVRFPGHTYDCLPSILGEAGYDTTAHHAYDGSFWNRFNMYRNLGYAKFYSKSDYRLDEPLGWSLGDKSFFRQTVEQLKQRNRSPFYAMTITLTSHHPYTMPASERKLDVGSLEGTMLGDYLQAVHYVDAAVGELVEMLKREGWWENTIFVFYGDHDNSITDWSLYERLFGRPLDELEKQRLLKQVPLILHLPGDAHAGTIDKPGGQLDIAPTLLHLLGIDASGRFLMGTSLLSDEPKTVVFRNGGFTDGRVFYVPSADGVIEHGRFYGLPDGAALDPAAFRSDAEAARKELEISDRVVRHDLIARFRAVPVVTSETSAPSPAPRPPSAP